MNSNVFTRMFREAKLKTINELKTENQVGAIAIVSKIYTKLKKVFQYVISIHIPIILSVFIPLGLDWIFPDFFHQYISFF